MLFLTIRCECYFHSGLHEPWKNPGENSKTALENPGFLISEDVQTLDEVVLYSWLPEDRPGIIITKGNEEIQGCEIERHLI